ncbi:hypothetical protein OROMI_024245 [Orobanche minor]
MVGSYIRKNVIAFMPNKMQEYYNSYVMIVALSMTENIREQKTAILGAINSMDVEFLNEPLMIDADSVTRSKKRPRLVWYIPSSENINANFGTTACAWSKAEEREQKLDEKGNTESLLLHCLIQIPFEIPMDEILPRLPVKSLSRFKCVSKSWKSLIESDRFMKIQYRNSAKNPRFIFDFDYYTMKECSLQLLLNSKEESDPTKNQAISGALAGCCNGVLCCYDPRSWRFSLWNPAIRVRIELPDNGGGYIGKCGFGWDELTGAYKVLAVLSECNLTKRMVGVFLRGNLHWVDMCHPQIECFDLEREEFGRIGLPLETDAKVPFHFPVLGEIGKSLSILIDWEKRLEVWVMKEYGVKDSCCFRGLLPFMEPKQKIGEKAKESKETMLQSEMLQYKQVDVDVAADTDAGFNPTPHKALKNFGNRSPEDEESGSYPLFKTLH